MRNLKISIFFAFSVVFFTGCGVKKMIKQQDKISYQVASITPESKGGKVEIQIKSTFPEKYFNKKATLTSVPILKNNEGDTNVLSDMHFQGEKADGSGHTVHYKRAGTFSSNQTIYYNPDFSNNKLSVYATVAKKGKEYAFEERVIGEINIDTKREDISPLFAYKQDNKNEKPTYYYTDHNYVPNKPIEKTAAIYFEFNRDELDWNIPFNKKPENIEGLEELFPFIFLYDSVQSVEIDGWASPEGELKRNMQLSNNRAERGKQWFEKELVKFTKEKANNEDVNISTLKRNINYQLKDNGEDWDGFISALSNSNIKEKSQIINVIQSQSDQGKKEQQIRNMIAIYDVVDNVILPSLRRAKIKVVCVDNLKSDELIAQYAVTTPDSLTNDELLYAASFTEDMLTKKQIFEKAIEIYPEDFRAYNDLACIKAAENQNNEAEKLLKKSNSLNPNSDIVLNNLGILSYQNKDYESAERYYTASQNAGMDQENNLFLTKDTILVTSIKETEPIPVKKPSTSTSPRRAIDEDITMAVKMNALLITGVLNPAFEIKLSKHFSTQISFMGTHWSKGYMFSKKPLKLMTGFIEARYYPKEVFRGFFVGINTGIGGYEMSRAIIPNFWHEPHNDVLHKGWNYMAGVSLGWAFPIKKHWSIEPFIGGGYSYSKYDNYVDNVLRSPERTQSAFVYAYQGGVYICYKF
ncbi:MAG: DUF3575 domain-containing protein [Bacteroidales bacterium]|nr:DUF3575 domain-containing protein [Bacteroidales bacterium]